MNKLTHILHLEDDDRDAELIQVMLESMDMACQITRVQTGAEFSEALRKERLDIILADYWLPGYDGASALRLAQELSPDVPFIFVSGIMGDDAAIEGFTQGATDYVLKNKLARLPAAVKRALRDAENRTERKHAEEELARHREHLEELVTERTRQLQESEHRYRQLFETMVQGVVYQDIDGKVISMNPAAERILGKTQSEFIGTTSAAEEYHTLREDGSPFPGPEHPAMVSLQTKREVRDVVMGVYNPRRKGYRWINIDSAPIFRPGEDSPYQVYTIFNDITERKQAEEALRTSEASYRALVGTLQNEISVREKIEALLATEKELISVSLLSIGEGVISTDKDGMIVLFNPAAAEITGYTSDETLGLPIGQIIHILDQQTHQVVADPIAYLSQLEGQEKNSPNYHSPILITKTQEKILISGKISPIRVGKELIDGYIIVFDDVTDKELLHAQSTLSQKMEAIGQLAAGIAHEINTPIQYVGDNVNFLNRAFTKFKEVHDAYLNSIATHRDRSFTADEADALAELIKSKKIEHYFAEFPTAVQETLDGVERVRKIVLAIREFSHPSQKEKALADINQGILTTITISHNEWKYCAEMETDLEPNLPLVRCQIDEINQVILNMIVNAAQAIQERIGNNAEEKGKIRIQTRQKVDNVLVTIQDTGSGIPPQIINRIFEPFFTTKGIGRGTGQGLSIAHNIIAKKHGGAIHVTSEAGQGTTFVIELPIINPDERRSDEPA